MGPASRWAAKEECRQVSVAPTESTNFALLANGTAWPRPAASGRSTDARALRRARPSRRRAPVEPLLPLLPTTTPDTAFKQQRMKAYSPTLTPVFVTMLFLVVGVPFVLMGGSLLAASKALVEVQAVYDGAAADSAKCQITSRNEAKDCTITMVAPSYMKAPVHVYYRVRRRRAGVLACATRNRDARGGSTLCTHPHTHS